MSPTPHRPTAPAGAPLRQLAAAAADAGPPEPAGLRRAGGVGSGGRRLRGAARCSRSAGQARRSTGEREAVHRWLPAERSYSDCESKQAPWWRMSSVCVRSHVEPVGHVPWSEINVTVWMDFH